MKSEKRYVAGTIAIASILFALVGCYYGPEKMAHVRMETATHTVAFEKGKKQISKTEYESLNAFIRTVPVSAISYVGLQADDSNARAMLHAKQIQSYLVKQGVDHNAIHLEPSFGNDSNTILLTIQYSVAIPPAPCPDWSKNASGTYNTTNGSDFGCAYYNNMIVQMANPADFESAQGQSPVIDAERESPIIQKYRSAGASGAAAPAAPSTGR